MKTTSLPLCCAALAACAWSLTGCSTWERVINLDFIDYPDSRIENLERLHTTSGRHHYSVTFVGDFEQAFNRDGHAVGGLHIGAPPSEKSGGKPKELPNPSEQCLELLTELLEFDSSKNKRLEAAKIVWCARIVAEDPAILSRERAALGLGELGRVVGISGPIYLPIDAPRASARETAQLLTDTVRAWRERRDGVATAEQWQTQVTLLQETSFDLDGSRRVLPVVAGLSQGLPDDSPLLEELQPLILNFEQRTIQFALAKALSERTGPASVVRAAAVRATAEAAGPLGLARLMPLLVAEHEAKADRDALVLIEIMGGLAEQGLPDGFPGVPDDDYARIRENWVARLVGIAVEDPEGRVRVKAMQALTTLEGGPRSLREEDWEEWFYARVEAQRDADGRSPVPSATEEGPPSDGAPSSETGPNSDPGQGGS